MIPAASPIWATRKKMSSPSSASSASASHRTSLTFWVTLRLPGGVLVTAIVANRLAVDSGLQDGDVVHSLNRTPIKTVDDLRAAFGKLQPGDPAAMLVERAGKLTYVTFEME